MAQGTEPRWAARYRLPIWALRGTADRDPDHALLASNASGKYQLYAWRRGQDPVQLTKETCGKAAGQLSPDGRWVVYLKDEGGREEGHYVRLPFDGGAVEDLSGDDLPPHWASGFSFDHDGRFVVFMTADPGNGYRLWRRDEDGARTQIYGHAHEASGAVLSRDGSLVAIAESERAPNRKMAVLVLSTKDGKRIAELWDGPDARVGPVMFPRIAGDPRLLVNSNRTGRTMPSVWNPETGERQDLDLDLPGELSGWRWTRSGRAVYVLQTHEGRDQLYRVELASGHSLPIHHPLGVVDGLWVLPDGRLWMNRCDAATPNQVVEIHPREGEAHVLRETPDVPEGTALSSVHFTGARGDRIQAWLGTPPGKGPFPALVHVHGGPAGQVVDRWMPQLQAWLDEGFAVLSVNYHGSTGFGREFEDSIKGDLMNLELADYAAAHAYLVAEGLADAKKIAIAGGSYGGFSTLSALTRQPDLWAAGVGSVIIGDLAGMYEDASAPLQGWCMVYTGGAPEEKPEIYRERSPITHVEKMKVPLLIIQGRNDSRTPARQCEKFVAAARAAGKDVTLTWFEEGHGSLDVGQLIENQRMSVEFAKSVLNGQHRPKTGA